MIYVIRLKEIFFLGSETIRTEGDASVHPCIRKKSSIRISEKKKRSCLYKKNKTMSQAKIAYFDSKQALGHEIGRHHPSKNEKRKEKAGA